MGHAEMIEAMMVEKTLEWVTATEQVLNAVWHGDGVTTGFKRWAVLLDMKEDDLFECLFAFPARTIHLQLTDGYVGIVKSNPQPFTVNRAVPSTQTDIDALSPEVVCRTIKIARSRLVNELTIQYFDGLDV